MKNPEEYLSWIDSIINLDSCYEDIEEVVKQIQKDAYNQAIDDAIHYTYSLEASKDSVLKLKKD